MRTSVGILLRDRGSAPPTVGRCLRGRRAVPACDRFHHEESVMALAKGPEQGVCSARGCARRATLAIIWRNPAIHTGRTKTWLSCPEHLDHLKRYFTYRSFPYEVKPFPFEDGPG